MPKRINTRLKVNSSFDKYSTKRVSYILVTKNRARFLKEALERAKKLKKENDELIVVDGSSTDNTLKVIKSFGNLIDKYISEPDISPTHATNKAILLSQGKYIKLIPDDDIFYERAMEQALTILEKHPEIDILECGGISYNKTTKIIDTFYKPPGINFGQNIDDMFRFRSSGLGLIIKRSVFSKVGLFPADDLISDATFIVNSFHGGIKLKFSRIKLFRFTIHGANTSLNPRASKLIYECIKDHASKKFFLRYAINWHISKYPALKYILLPVIFINNFIKKLGNKKGSLEKPIYRWDGGFS